MWEWLVFAGVMAVGQFSPGPDMLLLTRTAVARGRAAGCWTAFGICSGLGAHAVIAVAGMASLMARGGWLERALLGAAAACLVWLAIQLLRGGNNPDPGLPSDPEKPSVGGAGGDWRRGLLCNLLNPKVAVFLAGVTAPFLSGRSGWQWPLILWATIVLEGLLLWCLWVCLLQVPPVKRAYMRAARWFDLAFGLALLAVAAALVIRL